MRRSIPAAIAAVVAATFLLAVPAAAEQAEAGEQAAWTGWITDDQCGAGNANAKGKSCALSCYRNGARLVLYVKADDRLYGLDRQELAAGHVGHEVRVTGTIKDGIITVTRIERSASS